MRRGDRKNVINKTSFFYLRTSPYEKATNPLHPETFFYADNGLRCVRIFYLSHPYLRTRVHIPLHASVRPYVYTLKHVHMVTHRPTGTFLLWRLLMEQKRQRSGLISICILPVLRLNREHLTHAYLSDLLFLFSLGNNNKVF